MRGALWKSTCSPRAPPADLVASPRAVLSVLESAGATERHTAHSLWVFGTSLKMNQVSLFLQRKQWIVWCQWCFQAKLELWKMCFPHHKLGSFPSLTDGPDDIGAHTTMFWACVMKYVNLWKIRIPRCLPNDQYIKLQNHSRVKVHSEGKTMDFSIMEWKVPW